MVDATLAAQLRAAADRLTEQVADQTLDLVRTESNSRELDTLGPMLDQVEALMRDLLGEPDESEHEAPEGHGRHAVHTYRGTGPGSVALVGHYDTVWPSGTLAEWGELRLTDEDGRERITGPGAFDMKFGLVQAFTALALARESGAPVPTVRFVINSDEEIGSPTSRALIERIAQTVDASLVLESSAAGGAVKSGRKGVGNITISTDGIAAHAGLDPKAGASAVTALCRVILQLVEAADFDAGTTINPGLISGGTTSNVIAAHAQVLVDVRVSSAAEQERIDRVLDAQDTGDERVSLTIERDWNRPPMELGETSRPLLDSAREVAAAQGFELRDVSVGGASDANFIAGLDLPVLCGLGADGHGAHARGEFVHVDTIGRQVGLLAGLLVELAPGRPA